MKITPRVFSGMQPTGSLHLGNYLGAMVNWIEMQKTHECIYCVVDLHAITVWQDPAELENAIRQVTATYIAAGLDPKKSILFNQSQVSAHAELAWIFNCVARLGWLNRMTQFKEKAGKDREQASVGLYAYPNLMAADILAYRATHVPVGDDQKQHLELARDIAQKFNNDFTKEIVAEGFADGIFFPLPEPVITGPATRVMSLRDGTKKMSKSDPSDLSRINMTDDADTIAKKIQKAKTDPEPLAERRKGLRRASRSRKSRRHLCGAQRAADGGRSQGLRRAAVLRPSRRRSPKSRPRRSAASARRPRSLMDDPAEIDRILADGSARARAIAAPSWPRSRISSASSEADAVRALASGRALRRRRKEWQHRAHETAPFVRRRPSPQVPDRRRREPGSRKRALLRGEPRAAFVRVGRHAVCDRAGRTCSIGPACARCSSKKRRRRPKRFSVFSAEAVARGLREYRDRGSDPRRRVWPKRFSKLIADDEDIAILVLGASIDAKGTGAARRLSGRGPDGGWISGARHRRAGATFAR